VADGVSATNPKAIPGATIRYCITVSNAGPGTAAGLSASDADSLQLATYVAGSMRTGSSCGAAATAEDDNASAPMKPTRSAQPFHRNCVRQPGSLLSASALRWFSMQR
jgi:uncharacterized repeat protein (TIGR01451 family)